MKFWRACLLSSATLLASAGTVAADCSPAWTANLDRTITFNFASSSVELSVGDAARQAAGAWTDAIHSNTSQYPGYGGNYNNIGLQITSGSADITIYVDPQLDGQAWAEYRSQDHYLGISNDAMVAAGNDYNFLVSLVMHEMGHALYLENVTDPGCAGQSIMALLTPDNYAGWLKYGDYNSIDQLYPPPPSWCNPTECSPIILDLAGDGLTLTNPEVLFDMKGNGLSQLFGWTEADSDDGFLVLDRNGDGIIADGRELFGNFTPLSWNLSGPRAVDGFAALAWFDKPEHGGNGDGIIDVRDSVFANLQVWQDRNHNGVAEPNELAALSQFAIIALETTCHVTSRRDRFGNLLSHRSYFYIAAPGRVERRTSYDVFLASVSSR